MVCACVPFVARRDVLCLDVLQDVAQGADAVPDSTTTESESVSDVQLLRAGGDERTMFKLTLQVGEGRTHRFSKHAPCLSGMSTSHPHQSALLSALAPQPACQSGVRLSRGQTLCRCCCPAQPRKLPAGGGELFGPCL